MESIHDAGFVHRDIKPDNFLVGRGDSARLIHVVDFGCAKSYLHPFTKHHISLTEGNELTGTARYSSINTHLGLEHARRDDLESLAYVLIYLTSGTLPWQDLSGLIPSECAEIVKLKQQIPAHKLCRGLPKGYADFLLYARSLQFTERPDYHYARSLFKDKYSTSRCAFDWEEGQHTMYVSFFTFGKYFLIRY